MRLRFKRVLIAFWMRFICALNFDYYFDYQVFKVNYEETGRPYVSVLSVLTSVMTNWPSAVQNKSIRINPNNAMNLSIW